MAMVRNQMMVYHHSVHIVRPTPERVPTCSRHDIQRVGLRLLDTQD